MKPKAPSFQAYRAVASLKTSSARARQQLSDREKRILRLLCDGLTNAEIARRLGLSPATVKSELTKIFRKIEV